MSTLSDPMWTEEFGLDWVAIFSDFARQQLIKTPWRGDIIPFPLMRWYIGTEVTDLLRNGKWKQC